MVVDPLNFADRLREPPNLFEARMFWFPSSVKILCRVSTNGSIKYYGVTFVSMHKLLFMITTFQIDGDGAKTTDLWIKSCKLTNDTSSSWNIIQQHS
jgi:hypothetical protein